MFHTDARYSRVLLIRTPLCSLGSRTWQRGSAPKSQVIESSFRHVPVDLAKVVEARVNVVSILVESWGLFNDARFRSALNAPLTTNEIAGRYRVDIGSVPFVGSTIYGESRMLCSAIFDRSMEEINAARLSQCYPAQFAREGYSTIAIHGFYPHMYGRDQWFPKVGFRELLFAPDLKRMGMSTCAGGLVGICDSDVADFLHRRLLDTRASNPKFIHWTTLDSHLPVNLNPEAMRSASCGPDRSLQDDSAVCLWFSLVRNVNGKLAQIALDPKLPPTMFLIVGDHAPPFFDPKRRSLFSSGHVPYVILTPRALF